MIVSVISFPCISCTQTKKNSFQQEECYRQGADLIENSIFLQDLEKGVLESDQLGGSWKVVREILNTEKVIGKSENFKILVQKCSALMLQHMFYNEFPHYTK